MAGGAREELLTQFCTDLRLLWTQAGGPTLRKLSERVTLSKSQVGAILNGQIRQLPDWNIVRALVESFRQHAKDHDRLGLLSVTTGVEEYWRPRYAIVEHALTQAPRSPPGAAGDNGVGRLVPRQLPAAVRHFVGRLPALETLTGLIDEAAGAHGPVIVAVNGTAGVGKTTLAVHWAHQVADRFPDGQLYVNLRGFDPSGSPMTPHEALRSFLDALSMPTQQIPAGLDAQAALYRSLLAGRRVLVVLDNARDVEQVRPLLPGSATCSVVVTGRAELAGLIAAEGAHPITLGLLSAGEAELLLARRLGPHRVNAEPRAVAKIITCCARLPLALSMIAARAAAHPAFPLEALAGELDRTRDDLDPFDGGDQGLDVRAVLSWSYRVLTPPAARMFRLLGLHPGPDISASAAASLVGLPRSQTRRLLAELARAHLLHEHLPGRYACHDLLRAYAVEQAGAADQAPAGDPADRRHAAVHRVLDYYLYAAHAGAALLNPNREAIDLAAPQPGVTPEGIDDHETAMAWFTAEHANLVAAVNQAVEAGLDTHGWQLAWCLDAFFERRGLWSEWLTAQHGALAAARRLAEPDLQAHAHRKIACAHTWLGQYDQADAHNQLALQLSDRSGDEVGQARTHLSICWVLEQQGRPDEALRHAKLGLDLYQSAGHRVGLAVALNAVGWYHTQLGEHQRAIDPCQRALTIHQETGNLRGQAATWDSIGHAHHHLGDHSAAVACYHRALDLARRLGERYNEADTLTHLGETQHAMGERDATRESWRQALAILDQLRHPDAGPLRRKLHDLDATASKLSA